jgi:hypothetical protein
MADKEDFQQRSLSVFEDRDLGVFPRSTLQCSTGLSSRRSILSSSGNMGVARRAELGSGIAFQYPVIFCTWRHH